MTVKPDIPRTPAEEEILKRFEDCDPRDALSSLRETAMETFARTGLPHRRVEAYHYTDLKALIRAVPPRGSQPADELAQATMAGAPDWGAAKVNRLVLIDGHFVAGLSDADALGEGVGFIPLAKALSEKSVILERVGTLPVAETDPELALNTAFMQDGAVLEIAPGAMVTTPIEILHLATGEVASFPRHLVLVGKGASVNLVETYSGPAETAYQVHATSEVEIGEGATVTFLKRQEDGSAAIHLSTTVVRLAEEARYHQTGFAIGASLARAQSFVTFAGTGAEATLDGAILGRDRQHLDTTMVIDHAVPGCNSKEVIRAAIDDRAKGIFQGRIVVRPDAQQTDGRMMSRALLLSDGAEVDTKPELEIFADDVQCAHGATSGEIDEGMMFYLMSRGIPADEAETMLIAAFLEEVVDAIDPEPLREALSARIEMWLGERRRPA
ncbi:Fe-S cluster assembly protein SufD [Rhodobium gokarnense]|uniref:Fe-S cluster assembly protein SufD n=1 Tax=Rhodobium gokarnense TaxID=364296 RepID=A0ABT3HAM4_9HYPH|nr:Fe-S cluster assembly protein SufD [Rhodobium gokarnense]MCW2307430.1 Fe-S cluster assembly protein SufD [Rhodobium gokarnense]